MLKLYQINWTELFVLLLLLYLFLIYLKLNPLQDQREVWNENVLMYRQVEVFLQYQNIIWHNIFFTHNNVDSSTLDMCVFPASVKALRNPRNWVYASIRSITVSMECFCSSGVLWWFFMCSTFILSLISWYVKLFVSGCYYLLLFRTFIWDNKSFPLYCSVSVKMV